jgi:hypothetical protein
VSGPPKSNPPGLPEFFTTPEAKKPMSLNPGWICLGLGTCLCWFFVSGNAFFIGALVFGIIALAKGGRVWPCTVMIVASIFLPIFCFGLAFRIAMSQAEKEAKLEQAKIQRQFARVGDSLSKSLENFEQTLNRVPKQSHFPVRKEPNR